MDNNITERRLVRQYWYETEYDKTGWSSHGWFFVESGHSVNPSWDIVDHKLDKHGNPCIGIAERIVEYK
jgi:hypothetical protein